MREAPQRKHITLKRITMVAAAALVLGAFTCPAFKNTSHSLSDAAGSEQQSSTAKQYGESGFSTKEASKGNTQTDSQNKNTSANQTPAIAPKASKIITTNDTDGDAAACEDKMTVAANAYNAEVKKRKDDLDKSIKIPLAPISIIGGYIADFNNAVTDLFNDYANQASAEHCVWPLKAPATLPNNYYPN